MLLMLQKHRTKFIFNFFKELEDEHEIEINSILIHLAKYIIKFSQNSTSSELFDLHLKPLFYMLSLLWQKGI